MDKTAGQFGSFFELRLPGAGDRVALEYRGADQYQGHHVITNEEQAKQNVLMFRGARAFMKAVDRGLTDVERKQIKDIILRNPLDDGLDESARAQVDALVQELIALPKATSADNKALRSRLRDVWKSLGDDDLGLRKLYFFRQYTKHFPVPEHMFNAALEQNEYKPEAGDIVLEEGEDYHTSPAAAEQKRGELKTTLLSLIETAHQNVVSSGDKKKIEESKTLVDAANALLKPSIQADLELMHLLETTRITDRRLAEIASIFAPASDPASDELLNQVLNPHPVAQKLFGQRVELLCQDHVQYTEDFHVGNETIWPKNNYPRPDITNQAFDELALPLGDGKFNTPMDELFHMKLFRLADSYLGLNLDSDEGVLAFENFVHTYDISPGEATLERCLTSPPAHHTFEELPIIKFDGWDEADEVPDHVSISAEKVANR